MSENFVSYRVIPTSLSSAAREISPSFVICLIGEKNGMSSVVDRTAWLLSGRICDTAPNSRVLIDIVTIEQDQLEKARFSRSALGARA